MELKISTFILVNIAFFFAGIMDAVSGGGGLITLPTFLLTGFPVHMIAGTNQCSCLLGGITSLYKYIKSGKVYWSTAGIAAINSIIGSLFGARINLYLSEKYLQLIMIILLPLVAVIILLNKNLGVTNNSDCLTRRQLFVRAGLIGLLLGAYTGFYGAGGGTLLILAFTLFTKLDLLTASGNTKLCSVVAVISAAITYSFSNAVVWPVVLGATFFNIAGNYIGTELALRKGATIIRPMFLVVLFLLFIRLIISFLF